MHRATWFAAVIALAACSKKSEDARAKRCEAIWAKLATDLPVALDAEDKQEFLRSCQTIAADRLPCLEDPTSSPDCTAPGPAPKLSWITAEVDRGRVTARVPEGWEHAELMGDKYTPPSSARLGFFTELTIGSTCGGECGPQPAAEWAKRVESDVLEPARKHFAVDRDEAIGATGRLLVTHNRDDSPAPAEVHVLAAFWSDGGDQYVTCRADLDAELAAAVDEFAAACAELKVKSFSAAEP